MHLRTLRTVRKVPLWFKRGTIPPRLKRAFGLTVMGVKPKLKFLGMAIAAIRRASVSAEDFLFVVESKRGFCNRRR
jgi:hypothetical protein